MDQTYALVAGALATIATAAYLYRPDERVPISATLAFLLWGWLGLQGGAVEKITDSGSSVAAPIPDELRFVAIALSVVSLLAVVLYTIGVYPPEREGEGDPAAERFAWKTGD